MLQYTNSPLNTLNIKEAEEILTKNGFTNDDYILSLQGPTILLTIKGIEKMKGVPSFRKDLIDSGLQILG